MEHEHKYLISLCLALIGLLASSHILAKTKSSNSSLEPLVWITRRISSLGVEIFAPIDWSENTEGEMYRLGAPDLEQSGATITISERPGTLRDVAQSAREGMISQGGKITSEKATKISGYPADMITFEAVDQGVPITGTITFIEESGRVFLVDREANVDQYKRYTDVFEKVTSSLQEYRLSGKHIPESGFVVPTNWKKHIDNRLKISAHAPPGWMAKITKERFLTERVSTLSLGAPDFEKGHAKVMIAVSTSEPKDVAAWAKQAILGMPRTKILNAVATEDSLGRKGAVVFFTEQDKGISKVISLTIIRGKDRVIMAHCQADFKKFEKYNKTFNMIVGSIRE